MPAVPHVPDVPGRIWLCAVRTCQGQRRRPPIGEDQRLRYWELGTWAPAASRLQAFGLSTVQTTCKGSPASGSLSPTSSWPRAKEMREMREVCKGHAGHAGALLGTDVRWLTPRVRSLIIQQSTRRESATVLGQLCTALQDALQVVALILHFASLLQALTARRPPAALRTWTRRAEPSLQTLTVVS